MAARPPGRREEEEAPRIEATPYGVAARVPEEGIMTISAYPETTEKLLQILSKELDVEEYEPPRSVTELYPELIASLREYQLLSNTIANLAASSVLSKPCLFIPSVSFKDQVWTDFSIACEDLLATLEANASRLQFEIEHLWRRYVELYRDGSKRNSPEAIKVREELKKKIADLVKICKIASSIAPKVLYRIMSVRSLDLPPRLRNTLANIFMLRIDIMQGRGIERRELVEKKAEAKTRAQA